MIFVPKRKVCWYEKRRSRRRRRRRERGSLLFQKSFCTLSQFTFVIVVIVAGSLSLDFLYLEVMLQEISRIRAAADFHLILKTHGVPNHILVAEMTCAAPK